VRITINEGRFLLPTTLGNTVNRDIFYSSIILHDFCFSLPHSLVFWAVLLRESGIKILKLYKWLTETFSHRTKQAETHIHKEKLNHKYVHAFSHIFLTSTWNLRNGYCLLWTKIFSNKGTEWKDSTPSIKYSTLF